MTLADQVYNAVYVEESPALPVAESPPEGLCFDSTNERERQLVEWGLMVGLAYATTKHANPFDPDADDKAGKAASSAFDRVRRDLRASGIEGRV
jgi:hypothetical protein